MIKKKKFGILVFARSSSSRMPNKVLKKIIDKAGIIIECGVHYGASLSILSNLRGIYEPYNFSRKIVGFDTFEGFVGSNKLKDGDLADEGDYSVFKGWHEDL